MAALLAASVAAGSGPGKAPGPRADLAGALDRGLSSRAAGAPRAVWATSLLLGAPYLASPLGEGSGAAPDPDPRFRLDAFDCTTFVETALALGAAVTTEEAARHLDDIRYDGLPGYGRRNHYVESQWLPALLRKGWLAPVGAEVAGGASVPVAKRLDGAAWAAAERAGRTVPGLPAADLPAGEFVLPVVPLGALPGVAPRIPDGTVLLLVHEPIPSRPSLVSHMGIVVVRADGSRMLRHASDVAGVMRVRDEPLEAFARRVARQRWKVAGVSLYRIGDGPCKSGDGVCTSGDGPGPARSPGDAGPDPAPPR
jgi:hypothetical protein